MIDAMGLQPGAQVLDIGCGYGRHAMELAARGSPRRGPRHPSTPLLVRGGEEAHRRGLTINFVHGDMRELTFDAQFDGAYCVFSTFGFFDDETNKKTVGNTLRALKPGGRVLIEILNRDYVIAGPADPGGGRAMAASCSKRSTSTTSRRCIQMNRSVVFDDGRQVEQEIRCAPTRCTRSASCSTSPASACSKCPAPITRAAGSATSRAGHHRPGRAQDPTGRVSASEGPAAASPNWAAERASPIAAPTHRRSRGCMPVGAHARDMRDAVRQCARQLRRDALCGSAADRY